MLGESGYYRPFQGGANAGHTIINDYGKFQAPYIAVREYSMIIQQVL